MGAGAAADMWSAYIGIGIALALVTFFTAAVDSQDKDRPGGTLKLPPNDLRLVALLIIVGWPIFIGLSIQHNRNNDHDDDKENK